MKTALFTGAGASAAIGYPITAHLLPMIREGIHKRDLFDTLNSESIDREDAKKLGKYLNRLLPGFENAKNEALPLITDVFSLVEYSLVSNESLPVGSPDDLREFRDLLKQAMTCVLLDVYLANWNLKIAEQRIQKELLDRITAWIKSQSPDLALITTNYDIGLESELYRSGFYHPVCDRVDLGFDWRDVSTGTVCVRPRDALIRIFKLHGSLDVLRCSLCGHVYFNTNGTIAHQAFRKKISNHNTCVCTKRIKLDLHIVAPSLVRDVKDANLLNVWRNSLECLREADQWVIVGYSLPPEDIAIRSLLVRAYGAREDSPKVIVVQRSCDAESRYRMLFPDCKYLTGGLESFLNSVRA